MNGATNAVCPFRGISFRPRRQNFCHFPKKNLLKILSILIVLLSLHRKTIFISFDVPPPDADTPSWRLFFCPFDTPYTYIQHSFHIGKTKDFTR